MPKTWKRRLRASKLAVATLMMIVAAAGITATGATAAPGDPLPTATLSQVTPGATCQARTVLKGTAITSFDVEILDVVDAEGLGYGKLVSFKVTDPAVAAIGVAQGMSGSPILCSIGGEDRVIGAIAYGYDGVGPKGFATPIGDILNGQPTPLAGPRRQRAPEVNGHRLVELVTPLTVTGVRPGARGAVRKAMKARGLGSVVFAPQAAPVDVQAGDAALAPGGAFSANYGYGDVSISAICTISYRDGDRFWGCGHPLDLAGQRDLSVSGAYIYDVLGQPWDSNQSPFKFGTATATQVGAMLYDGPYAVSGRLGRTAPAIPVKVRYRSGAVDISRESRVAYEEGLPGGSPDGFSWTDLTAAALTEQAQFSAAGQPTLQHGRICFRQAIIGSAAVANGCHRFATGIPSWMSDETFTGAAGVVDLYATEFNGRVDAARYRKLTPGALDVTVNVSTGPGLRTVIALRAVGRLRAGRPARLRVVSVDRRGRRYTRTVRVRIPRKVVRGKRRGKPIRGSRLKFSVESSALSTGEGEGDYLVTDSDARPWETPGNGADSDRQLRKVLKAAFRNKGRLLLGVPGLKKKVGVPLPAGTDVTVGRATLKAYVRRAAGRR